MQHASSTAPPRGGLTGRRLGVVIASAVAASLLLAAPAAGDIQGPCDGQVVIDGVTYGPHNDSRSNPIVVPEDAETAAWQGTTGVPITDHSGTIGVVVGPATVEIASWGDPNTDRETSADGVYEIADAREELPTDLVGLFEVTGSHSGTGGTCTGTVMVKLEGNPLSTPVGSGAAAATAVGLAGLAAAGTGSSAARGTGGPTGGGSTGPDNNPIAGMQ